MWAGLALVVLMGAEAAAPSPAALPSCPSDADVDAELGKLGATRSEHPEIAIHGNTMRVVLRGPDGATVGSREIEAPASCHERATVAAVLVAAWIGLWREAPKADKATLPVTSTGVRVPETMNAKPTRAPGAEIGLVLAGLYDGDAAAPGALLEVRLPLLGPWLGRIGFSASTEREESVGVGRAGYMRPAMEIGPGLSLGQHGIRGELDLSVLLGLLILQGENLPVTHARTRATAGVATDARLVFSGTHLSPFLSAGGSYWPGRQTLTIDGDPATAELPRWDAHLGMGVLWHPGP